jgi:predicted DCC family thiol-disulfide oxidoreductase YuxK
MATETLLRPTTNPETHADEPAAAGRASQATPLTVVFDGECGVCRETINRLRRWDREDRFEFLPLQAAATSGRPLLERLAAEKRFDDAIHVVDEAAGRVVAGGHAALAIIDALPGGWLLRPWAVMPQTAVAADVVYRLASRHRDRLAWLMGLRDDVRCPVEPGLASGSGRELGRGSLADRSS